MSIILVRAGAELLTVGFGQGCRSHRTSLYTNVFLKLHVNLAYTMEMLYWVYQLFGDNSPLGKLVVNPGSPWQSTNAKSIIGTERLWDSQVSAMYADIQIQVSQHLRVLSSQASKQQDCSCAVKERCLAWWCRLAARLESPALQNTPDGGARVSSAWLQGGSGTGDANLCSSASAPAPSQTYECTECFDTRRKSLTLTIISSIAISKG